MMRSLLAALIACLLVIATAAAGPNYAPGSLDAYFALEWQVTQRARGPVLEGYVHNRYGLYADRMRLGIEMLDGSGRVVGSTSTWVLGGVPPYNRTWFQAAVPAAAAYRVEILSFDWIGRGGAGQ